MDRRDGLTLDLNASLGRGSQTGSPNPQFNTSQTNLSKQPSQNVLNLQKGRWVGKLVFIDHVRCLAATKHLENSRNNIRNGKIKRLKYIFLQPVESH